MKYIIYIENIPCPQAVKTIVQEFQSGFMFDSLLVVNGDDGIKQLQQFIASLDSGSEVVGIMCEASIPTFGDSLVLIQYIKTMYTNIKIGIISKDYSSDLEDYPIDDNTKIPAGNKQEASIGNMLTRMFPR